jgi:hypothetical protein
MEAQTLRVRRIPMAVAITAIGVTLVGAAITATVLRPTSQPVRTHEASSVGSPTRTVATVPWLLSSAEAGFLVRRGATSAELAAENQQRWHRLQLRMLEDPWVIGILRHRPGTTIADLRGVYLSRR